MKYLSYATTRTNAGDRPRTEAKAAAPEASSTWDLTLEALEQSHLIEVIPEAVPKSEEFALVS